MRQIIYAVISLGIVVLSVTCVPVAYASDFPARATSATGHNWAGWYAGLNAGGNAGTSNAPTVLEQGAVACANCYVAPLPGDINAQTGQSFKTSGFTGGVQGGYNWQSGNLVAGVEADFEYFRSAGSTSTTGPFVGGSSFTVASSLTTDWLFTVRPRIGFAADNWLFYGTGGLAVTKLNANWSFTETFHPVGSGEAASASAIKAGWVLGAGVEAALSSNFSLGIEYFHVKFSDVSMTDANLFLVGVGPSSQVFNHGADLAANIIRVRLNKMF